MPKGHPRATRVKMYATFPHVRRQYRISRERKAINDLVEKSILEADRKGVKVLSLGLLNQAKELNGSGELFLQKYPTLKLKLVDGTSLAAAVVLNSIPPETKQVLFKGQLSKVARAIAQQLSKSGVQVFVTHKHELCELESYMSGNTGTHLSLLGESICQGRWWRFQRGTGGANWWQQYSILFWRGLKERRHNYLSRMRVTQVLATVIILGLLWWHSDSTTPKGLQDQAGLFFFISVYGVSFLFLRQSSHFLKREPCSTKNERLTYTD